MIKMEDGFKNEENARQRVQKELAVMKDEIENLRMGSGSTVCSEATTGVGLGTGKFARPPPLTSRWNEIFVPRRMEFTGWITDYTKSSIQGITDDEVLMLVWFHDKPTSGLTGARPGRNTGPGRPRRLSVRGSQMKRTWQQ